MVPHSSILAWRIPLTEEPGGLQFRGSQTQTQLKHTCIGDSPHIVQYTLVAYCVLNTLCFLILYP